MFRRVELESNFKLYFIIYNIAQNQSFAQIRIGLYIYFVYTDIARVSDISYIYLFIKTITIIYLISSMSIYYCIYFILYLLIILILVNILDNKLYYFFIKTP